MNNMIHQILLLFLISPVIIHSKNSCPISTCGLKNNGLQIKYPFKLQTDHPPNDCDHSFINLRCDDQGQVVINLPSSGDFYVISIDYALQIVTLTDPGKCLPGRLMMKSVSPYPLEALFNKDYTYYTCPKGRITPPFSEIHCLSNSVNATIVAADLPNEFMREMDGCTSIFSSMIPVGWSDEYSFLELQLTWNVPGCRECEDLYTPLYSDDSKSNQVAKFLQSSAFIASAAVLITFSGLACLLRISKIIEGRATTASNTIEDAAATESTAATSTTVAPPGTTSETLGAEKSHVKSFSEVVFLGESQGALVSCSICIEEYSDKDRVRYLDQCGHFFHVECIDQWLQKNNTCPVCRTSLS